MHILCLRARLAQCHLVNSGSCQRSPRALSVIFLDVHQILILVLDNHLAGILLLLMCKACHCRLCGPKSPWVNQRQKWGSSECLYVILWFWGLPHSSSTARAELSSRPYWKATGHPQTHTWHLHWCISSWMDLLTHIWLQGDAEATLSDHVFAGWIF